MLGKLLIMPPNKVVAKMRSRYEKALKKFRMSFMNAEDTMKTQLWLPDVLGVSVNSSQRQRPRGTPGSLDSWFQGILPLYATHALLFGLWLYTWGVGKSCLCNVLTVSVGCRAVYFICII